MKENERLKEKLDALHEQNASLTSQNLYLKNRVETMNFELIQSNTRVCIHQKEKQTSNTKKSASDHDF